MNGELDSDNLEAEINTNTQELRLEPSYLSFLRSEGYTIDGLNSVHTVQRDKSKTPHLVVNIATYDLPKDHPELDYASDAVDIWCCDCWDWRKRHSADVSEGQKPSDCGTCDHIRRVSKTERAEADDSQATLK